MIVAYRPLVFWLARRFSLDEGTAKDLLQEGMLALIKAVDAYDVSRGNKFTTYAFYRIRGHMINFLERSEKRAPYPVDMEEEIAQPGECVAVEWRLLLEEAMGALTLKERDIIQALVVEGKKAGDVARDTAIDVSHVYRIRRKALARLRTALGLPAPLGDRKRG